MVDPELFERYRKALGANADLTEAAVRGLLERLDGMTELEQAEYLMANYPKLVTAYGKVAADVARQFYQEQRDAHFEGDEDAEGYEAQAARPIPERWGAEDVRDAFTGDHGMSVGALPGKAVKRVMERADETIIRNADRDPARPKWAVVPRWDACAWCVMVGSRGFVYRSELTADAQRHANCKCAVVADFDAKDPRLAGYDPDALYERYREDLADGTVTTHGSSIGSIGVMSGSGEYVDPQPQKGGRSGGTGLNKREKQRIANWTNDAIAMFGQVQDVGQLKTVMDKVNETWAKSGSAFTDKQVQGIRRAFDRARNRLEEDAAKVAERLEKGNNAKGGKADTSVGVERLDKGGSYGAWSDKNDPDHTMRDKHADRYYEELRNRDEDVEVQRVAENTGIGESIVRQAYRHVFTAKHYLAKGYAFFDTDYDMSQSWQRISTGVDIQPHDLILVYHEAIEDDFMYLSGLSYRAAHDATCAMGYDWAKACDEWKRVNGLI